MARARLVGPFAKGMLLGLSIAAPVGPMALLCLRSSLMRCFQGPVFVWVNRISGAALAGFGLWALTRAAGTFLG